MEEFKQKPITNKAKPQNLKQKSAEVKPEIRGLASQQIKNKPIHDPNFRFQRDRDKELVKGVFKFYERPGGTLTFPWHKYKGNPYQSITLVDGEMYSLPLEVAKHLNSKKGGCYIEHEYALDEDGKPKVRPARPKRRYGFHSLDFTQMEEIDGTSDIITVEKII